MQAPNHINIIKRLCTLEARPPIILSYFRGIPLKTIRAIYKETTGKSPVKGQLPVVTQLYFEHKYAVQASVLAKVYIEAVESSLTEAEALIQAYEMLLSIYGKSVTLNFSQSWHITRYIELGQFVLKRCHEGHSYLHNKNGLRPPCPVCWEVAKLTSTEKRIKNGSFSTMATNVKGAKMRA